MIKLGLDNVCKTFYFSNKNSEEIIFSTNEEIIKFNYMTN